MSEKEKYPSALAERFQIRLPVGLRDRIKAYAERHGRSMNTEIVRVLEKEFPEPWPLERRVSELLAVVDVFKAGKVEAIDHLLSEFMDTLLAVRTGRLKGLSDEERDRIDAAFESWREDQAKYDWIDQPELDQEEQEMFDRTGGTEKFAEPPPKKPDPLRDNVYLMDVLPPATLAELAKRLSEADTEGAAKVLATISKEDLEKAIARAKMPILDRHREAPPAESDDPFNIVLG